MYWVVPDNFSRNLWIEHNNESISMNKGEFHCEWISIAVFSIREPDFMTS